METLTGETMKTTRIRSVSEFGVIPDSDAVQTSGFQKALDSFYPEGGVLRVPAGKYVIGGIRLRSGTTLYLCAGAKLIATRDIEQYGILENDALEPVPDDVKTDKVWEKAQVGVKRDYTFLLPASRWNHGIIRAYRAENIAVIGEEGSLIDGQNTYDPIGEEHYRGVHGMNFRNCRGITLRGYTVQNTGNWAHAIYHSENILCENVTVLAGHDGIHMTNCSDIEIKNCSFYTGDDCIAGFANLRTHVTDCVCNTACSAFRFGGTGLLAERCRMFGPAKYYFRGSLTKEEKAAGSNVASCGRTNMLSAFTYYADFSTEIPEQPGNLVFRDCIVENADRFLHYNFSGNEVWQLNRPLESVTFEGFRVSGLRKPLTAYGSPEVPLTLTLKNCDFSMETEAGDAPFLRTAYCKALRLDSVRIRRKSRGAFAWLWSEAGEVALRDVTDEGDAELNLLPATVPFSEKPI